MKITKLFSEFFESEKSGGILLILCTIVSIILANTGIGVDYIAFWETPVLGMDIQHWINDGLMAIFFLMIGLELEREIYHGELSSPREAILPMMAAIGGMIFPACIYYLCNRNGNTMSGIGIPVATDIAFSLGVLSLLGSRIPVSLKVFLTALAIIDDIGAILVIAFGYSQSLDITYLLIAFVILVVLFICNRLKITALWIYLIGGIGMWYFFHHSGIHATIAGVILAFVIPFGDGSESSLSYRLQSWLHSPVSYIILPIFALANTAISLNFGSQMEIHWGIFFGVVLGLTIGKPLGILIFTKLALVLDLGRFPEGLTYTHILGLGAIAGIGFTMSIFIAMLAFDQPSWVNLSKLAVILASLLSSVIGYFILKKTIT